MSIHFDTYDKKKDLGDIKDANEIIINYTVLGDTYSYCHIYSYIDNVQISNDTFRSDGDYSSTDNLTFYMPKEAFEKISYGKHTLQIQANGVYGDAVTGELPTLTFTFNKIPKNNPPKIFISNAVFPNITFQVTDDKSVSKVDVILNNNIKDTITNNLDKSLISNFTREELTWGENIVTIKATDNDGASTTKQVKVIKDKITVPAEEIQVVKNNKIYKIVSTQETPEELIIKLDRDLEDASNLAENIEILNDYATVQINNKQMKHISSITIKNNEVEDKFVLDGITRQVTTRVDLFRHDTNSNIYIRELQEAFQYNQD